MKYQIWERGNKKNELNFHKLIKRVKNKKEFEYEIKKLENVEIIKSYLRYDAIGDIRK